MGGKTGFYYHLTLNNYTRYLEISIVPNTKFSMLKPVLDTVLSQWEYSKKVIHDGSPPYNSHKWQRYMEDIGAKMDLCTPDHPQNNGMVEKMIGN